ncbi:MAG: hypothetical protein HKN67_03435 [Saprospiraceae bacterium]|nr:hypothetical protein [Saprospiraceae bacterium]
MKYLGKYLKSLCDFTLSTRIPSWKPDVIIVIPVYDEDDSFKQVLNHLLNQTGELRSTQVLVLFNYRDSSPEALKSNTKSLYQDIKKSYESIQPGSIRFEFFIQELSGKKAGVGLARKMLMDLAFRIFHNNQKNGIIVNLDADTIVQENYLDVISAYFDMNPLMEAGSIAFAHPVEGLHSDPDQMAAAQYELHLRFFINMQRLIHLPYAYQTIGSAMAVRAWSYAKEGGMNKRQAGEDFYFLHKFSKNNTLGEINTTCVFPSTRKSTRVPFGTGKAIIDLTAGNTIHATSYNPQSFLQLQSWIQTVFENYHRGSDNLLPGNLIVSDFVKYRNEENKLEEIRTHTTGFPSFRKRFFQWFDAFMLMKYLHFLRDKSFHDLTITACVQYLFDKLELKFKDEIYYLLDQLRQHDLKTKYNGISTY